MMTESYSLWDRLKQTDKPIIMYGTGNGADKIIDVFIKKGITLSAVFASNGFVRDRVFRGYQVRSYQNIIDEYGSEIIIVLAFGSSLPEVCGFIEELDYKHELIIPEVPLYGGDLFDFDYFTDKRQSLENAASLLSDNVSKKLFEDAVNFRLTGKLCYLRETEDIEKTLSSLLGEQKIRTIIDGGAFIGDTAKTFASVLSPEKIYAVEADPRTYNKLCAYAERENRADVIPVNAVLSDSCGTAAYVSSSSRGSGESGKNKRAKTVESDMKTIDAILDGESIDLIKLDVEGDEMKALCGALDSIKKYEPNLSVSLYHRTEDLFELIEHVHSLLPSHKLYLRRVPCIPMWDLTLYAIKNKA